MLKGLIDKLAQDPEQLRAKNCREWACRVAGATPINEVTLRRHHRTAGVIQNIRIDPRRGSGSVEATITDGTGHLVAKWLGRQKLSGIRLGRGLIVEGMAGCDADGELVVLNPEYELVNGPG